MFGRMTFQERAEILLIAALAIGFILIAQRSSQLLFQIGLVVVVISTFLEIAVGNVRTQASTREAVLSIIGILLIIAAVFVLGIYLVPYLTELGR